MKVRKIKSLLNTITGLSDVLKEGQRQKKWSAKRSVSGLLVTSAVADMSINGLTELNIGLSFIAVLPLCLSVFQK